MQNCMDMYVYTTYYSSLKCMYILLYWKSFKYERKISIYGTNGKVIEDAFKPGTTRLLLAFKVLKAVPSTTKGWTSLIVAKDVPLGYKCVLRNILIFLQTKVIMGAKFLN